MSQSQSRARRIAIIHPQANLDSIPSLTNAATLLAEHGYLVELYIKAGEEHLSPSFNHPNISMDYELFKENWFLHEKRAKPDYIPNFLASAIHVVSRLFAFARNGLTRFQAALKFRGRHKLVPYRCFIGVDPEGLAEAFGIKAFVRGDLIYYSLELLLGHEIQEGWRKGLKAAERFLTRRAAFIIIQDPDRARLFQRDNQVPNQKIMMAPNGPLGHSRKKSSDFWRKRFNLAPNTRIVLHAGSLGDWTGVEGIVKSVALWPEPWVLVVHTRMEAEQNEDIQILKRVAPAGRVFFSLKPVPQEQYDELVDGADVGIAFYIAGGDSSYTQSNIETIGLSSGKISYCLRAGKPVLVNAAASVSRLMEKEGCGVSVESFDRIGQALSLIDDQYDDYSENALLTFDRHLDFTGKFEKIIRRIDQLGGEKVDA